MNSDSESVKNYWEQRAAGDTSAQSTTMDIWLREIEARVVRDRISKVRPKNVIDFGCGDGRTTLSCAEAFPEIEFGGYDYSESMIRNARANLIATKCDNINFEVGDILNKGARCADFIFTTRCLINLTSWDSQKRAIANISESITDGGVFLVIENFIEGHEAFNLVRRDFGLPEIPVRPHNLFFNHSLFIDFVSKDFEIVEDINISSQYYLVSRVIYSKLCAQSGMEPDYNNEHHVLSSSLPFAGNYGPTKALMLKKRG